MDTVIKLDSPLGSLSASIRDDRLCGIHIGMGEQDTGSKGNLLCEQLQNELQAYFAGTARHFSIPLELQGTEFQKRVWHALTLIPAGKTLTYGQLAEQLNSSPRAVGNACRANPVPIIIPCHRVIAKRGIGGYDGQRSGQRLDIKRWLLRHEGVAID